MGQNKADKFAEKMDREIKMIAAVTEALTYRRKNPELGTDGVIQHISRFVSIGKDDITKMGMIAAASRALSLVEREPKLQDKEIIRRIMRELPELMETAMIA